MRYMRGTICAVCIVLSAVVGFIAYCQSLSCAHLRAWYAASARIREKELDKLAEFHIQYLSASGISPRLYVQALGDFSLANPSVADYLRCCRRRAGTEVDTSEGESAREIEPK